LDDIEEERKKDLEEVRPQALIQADHAFLPDDFQAGVPGAMVLEAQAIEAYDLHPAAEDVEWISDSLGERAGESTAGQFAQDVVRLFLAALLTATGGGSGRVIWLLSG
jgi:hypothetical protein